MSKLIKGAGQNLSVSWGRGGLRDSNSSILASVWYHLLTLFSPGFGLDEDDSESWGWLDLQKSSDDYRKPPLIL